MAERDFTVDLREQCSSCGKRLSNDEKVFRCSDHATEPVIFPTEGYKYNGHQVVDFSLAVYCSDCVSKFERVIGKLRQKMNKNSVQRGTKDKPGG